MSTVAHGATPITREGYERLRSELDALEALPAAGAFDDQEEVERRIDELRAALALATIAPPPADGVIDIGQRVRIRLAPGRAPIAYHLVGALEADAAARRISIASPIGQALIGRDAGDHVEVETPGGVRRVEIVSVGGDAPV